MTDRPKNATYRLSQVEAVIAALFDGPYRSAAKRANSKLDEKLSHRIRRMLQIDRAHGINVGAKLSEHPMAFFDELPVGKGHPVRFTPRKAFNLIIACELLRFGFNQGEVVEAIGMVDASLEQAFDRSVALLETDGWMKYGSGQEREQKAADLRWFLLIAGEVMPSGTAERTEGVVKDGERLLGLEVAQDQNYMVERLRQLSNERLRAIGVLELSQLAARILELLPLQKEKRAGRP